MTRGFIPVIILSIILSSFSLTIVAQSKTVTLTDAIDLAVQKNKQLESYRLKAEQSRKLKAEAFDPGSTGIYYSYDENNIAENNLPLKVLGVEQSFDFPTVYLYRLRAARTQVEVDNLIFDISRNELTKKVSQAYYKVILIQSKIRHLRALDSLYEGITTAADLRYRTGESNYLQLLTSRVRAMQMKTRNVQITEDLKNELQKFQALIQMDIMIKVPSEERGRLEIKFPDFDQHFGVMMFDEMQKLSQDRLLVEKNRLLPAISLQYFQGTNKAENAKIYPGFQVGISLPVFFGAQNARIQAARLKRRSAQRMRLITYPC